MTADQLDIFDALSSAPIEGEKRAVCSLCGHVHTSRDARAVGRFASGPTTYRAASMPSAPDRATRTEAESDECSWRIRRLQQSAAPVEPQVTRTAVEVAAPMPIEPAPSFPAPMMESAARAKAWTDFLTHVRTSLIVWEIDREVRDNCASVTDWLRSCRDDLNRWVTS